MRSPSSTEPPAPAPIDAEPLDLAGMLDRALALLRRHWRTFLMIALATVIPTAALQAAIAFELPRNPSDEQAAVAGLIGTLAPLLLLTPISATAATVAAIDSVNGVRPALGRSLELVGGRFWPMAAAVLMATAATVAGAFAFILPAVFFYVLLTFAAQCAVVERLGPMRSLRRSAELVRGGWWRVFGLVFVVLVMAILVIGAFALPADRIANRFGETGEILTLTGVQIVIGGVVQAFIHVALAVLYLDRRLRLEGRWPVPVRA